MNEELTGPYAGDLSAGIYQFSTDDFLSLTVDSVCTQDGFARLGIRPRALDALLPDIVLESDRTPLGVLRRKARR